MGQHSGGVLITGVFARRGQSSRFLQSPLQSEKPPSPRQPRHQQARLVSHQLDVGPLRLLPLSRLLSNGLAVIGRFPPGIDASELRGIGLLSSGT